MGISSPIGLDEGGLTKCTARATAPRSRGDTALRILQTLLLVTGSTLLVVYAAAQADAARERDLALEAFRDARSEHVAGSPTPQGAEPTSDTLSYSGDPDLSLWGTTRIAAYRNSVSTHRQTPLGVLTIPTVQLEAPIFDGTAEITLNRGIGRIEGTADVGSAGNLGLAGHRDGFFRSLKDVKIGDAIDVESLGGTTRYRITELVIVEPTDVYVLAPTNGATLTLVTCYPFYFVGEAPQRYIVKAVAEDATAIAHVAP